MLKKRILTAVILVLVVIAVTFSKLPSLFDTFTLIVMLAAAAEWAGLLKPEKPWLARLGLILLTVVLAFAVSTFVPLTALWGLAALVVLWGLIAIIRYNQKQVSFGFSSSITSIVACVVLVLASGFSLIHIHNMPHGPWMVFNLVILVAVNDSLAYFSGRAYGKRKLCAVVSPNKTWEGCITGIFSGLVWTLFVAVVFWRGEFGYVKLLIIALPTLIAAVIGDLFISLLKRKTGLKDTGQLLPGHGGLLDRIDALLMAAPVFALTTHWMGLPISS